MKVQLIMAGQQVKNITPPYRKEGDWYLIELKIKTLNQLYHSLDPAPFRERDLDDAAASYIYEAMQELRSHPKVKILVYLQEEQESKMNNQVPDAIHYYFAYRARTRRIELRQQLRIGSISLFVGLLFMAGCFKLSSLLSNTTEAFLSVLREGSLIIGWVTMWKPLDIFLYSWWPVLGEIRLYERIAIMPVEVDYRTINLPP